MKIYIFLLLIILESFIVAGQRQILGRCDAYGKCLKGQEDIYLRDSRSYMVCYCAKLQTPYELAEAKGGGCDAHVEGCEKGDQQSCAELMGDGCEIRGTAVLGSDPGTSDNLGLHKSNCKPLCNFEKVVELCDKRYITNTEVCNRVRKSNQKKLEQKCQQAKDNCLKGNSCRPILKDCDATTAVDFCDSYPDIIPADECNEQRVKVGHETRDEEVPLSCKPHLEKCEQSGYKDCASVITNCDRKIALGLCDSKKITDRNFCQSANYWRQVIAREDNQKQATCQSYKTACLNGNERSCGYAMSRCAQKDINDLCETGKIKDIYKCNYAKAAIKGPSLYCDSYLESCLAGLEGCVAELGENCPNEVDCDQAFRYCGNIYINNKCRRFKGVFDKPDRPDICLKAKEYYKGKTFSAGECNKYKNSCIKDYNSLACKNVISGCRDQISDICSLNRIWTKPMCDDIYAPLQVLTPIFNLTLPFPFPLN